jgi:Flp pilus assembly protein TadD
LARNGAVTLDANSKSGGRKNDLEWPRSERSSMNRGQVAVSILCLLLAGCGRNASDYVHRGAKLYAAGHYADATINYRKAIQKDPKSGAAYYGLSQSLLKEDKAPDAFDAIRRAVELAPENMDAKRLMTDLALLAYLSDSGRPKFLYDALNRLAAQFLAKDSNSFEGFRLKGYLAVTDHNTVDAVTSFRRANQIKPMQPDVVLALAQILLQDKPTAQEGERLIHELIGKHPDTSLAYDLLYQRYTATNRLAEAETILLAKVAANPLEAQFVTELAEHYRRFGNTQQMTGTLARLLDNPKKFPQARLQVGDYYNRAGEQATALAYYQEGARAGGADKPVYRQRLVITMAALGRADEALAIAEEALRDQPHDAELRTLHALLMTQLRKLDGAIQEWQGLVKEKSDDPVLRFHLGRALILNGRLEAGRGELREAVRLRADYLEPRMALASLALDSGQFQAAQEALEEVLAISPDNPDALVLRAGALQGLARYGEARAVLTGLKIRFPNTPGLDVESAFIKLREGKLAEAERVFRKRYQPGQDNLRPLVGLVETLTAEKRSADAQRALEAELATVPNRPPVQYLLADSYAASGNLEKAGKVFEQLAAAHPELPLPQERLGELQFRAGDVDRGLATLDKATKVAPRSIEPLMLLGLLQEQAQRFEDAKQTYRAALKLDAGNVEALNNLAFLTAETGGNLEEALHLAAAASQKAPNQPNVVDTIGYVYLKMKKGETALQVFRNLARKYPSNPTFRYHNGLALLEIGDKGEATKEFEAALAGQPLGPVAAKIKQALGQSR